MKKYIKNLITLINYERDAEIDLMTREISTMSGQKREELGRAINKVKGKSLGKELGLQIVQFGRSEVIDTEISVGDMILVSTDNPLRSDLTGTVTEKGARFIKVAFDKRVPKWAIKKKVRLDLYANDITFRRMEDNLNHLSLKGKNALEYILNERNPKKNRDVPYISYIDENLNDSQKKAIENALSCENFFLIHGPFGTGKTRTLVELISQETRQGHKVLATAESNAAVDNILERLMDNKKLTLTRLGHPQRVSKHNITQTLAYKAENHKLNKKIKKIHKKIDNMIEKRKVHTKPTPQYRRGYGDYDILHIASKGKGGRGISSDKMKSMAKWIEINQEIDEAHDEIKRIENRMIKDIIDSSDVILATNSSSALEAIARVKFDVAIIDEASQATIPSILIPIAKAHRFILAGDHKQLPPTIISDRAGALSKTLFEELIRMYPFKSQLLNIQYRMNSLLMKFPNEEFYNNGLKSDSSVDDINIKDILDSHQDEEALLFIDTSDISDNRERHLKDSKSIVNEIEAEIAIRIADDYLNDGVDEADIGIISPYADQVKIIQENTPIEVKTVDGFQGREKEIIIISTVRSNDNGNIGFLSDLRRLNVAITRAKRKLIIIGNIDTLITNPTYERLIKFCEDQDLLVKV
ncbi:MAG: IGHMBP2 family helicase [Methanobrevibacter thaueri]|uniref:IGHMBP2 family helicase n=1 Tax=Methanobrevibacter thaueri TaxID=190975 RepID=A0A8T3VGB5_9EURY|nr:IGHMBP2 family helicase [Methanobrevibacter thaueri]MBE6502395.1 IGHMBP2 family helicase [Methanobrevibacter thaueri]